MRRTLCGLITTITLLLNFGCSGPSHMLLSKDNTKLDIRTVKPEKGKAALVVTRTTWYRSPSEFETYLDKKMIGVTKGRGFFIKTDIQPGIHYLIAISGGHETGKINFEAERTYFINYNPDFKSIAMYPQDPNKTISEMDEDCKLIEYNLKDPGDDLSDEDYNEAIQDYEKMVAKGDHKTKEYATYRGFLAPVAPALPLK